MVVEIAVALSAFFILLISFAISGILTSALPIDSKVGMARISKHSIVRRLLVPPPFKDSSAVTQTVVWRVFSIASSASPAFIWCPKCPRVIVLCVFILWISSRSLLLLPQGSKSYHLPFLPALRPMSVTTDIIAALIRPHALSLMTSGHSAGMSKAFHLPFV